MPPPVVPLIRAARLPDVPAILEIYNHYVRHSTCTYQLEEETLAQRKAWLKNRKPEHAVLVAELDRAVAGWAALSPYSLRGGWRPTVEDAVYLREDVRRRGIGRLLLGELLATARRNGFHSVVARISSEQEASLRLHAALGFAEVGRMREVGWKFGQWLDVVHWQKILEEPAQRK